MRIDRQALLATGLVAGVECHDEIDSTQSQGRRLAASLANDQLPHLILADRQTAGRGRGDHRWWTGADSLAMSLVFAPENFGLGRPARPARSLAVGVALIEALNEVIAEIAEIEETTAPLGAGGLVRGARLGLRWPNDVYLGDRKLAGVLLDLTTNERHILGVGVNTNNRFAGAPIEVRARAVSLLEAMGRPAHSGQTGESGQPERLIDHGRLVAGFLRQLTAWLPRVEHDPERLGRRFKELCLQLGERLTVHAGHGPAAGEPTRGVCLGIADDGALLLDTPSGVTRIYSGTLHGDRV